MLLTAIVGMILASPPNWSWKLFLFGSIGIGLAASSGAILNHLVDKKLDALMTRTQKRPIASGRVTNIQAIIFATILGISAMFILIYWVNLLTAILSLLTLIGYAVVYSIFLKRSTSQNIVIGGLAGAMPPLLGWTAVTGEIEYVSWLLVLIIFTWTPPHFWSLSIFRYEDYKKTNLPMLPVTHGIAYTKTNILIYTLLLSVVSFLPFAVAMSGLIYFISAIILDSGFIYFAWKLKRTDDKLLAQKTFRYSIFYLTMIFIALIVDHFVPVLT